MGQDFTKGLNVCIGNYGYYNEGSLHDAWITLPKTEAEIRDFLHLNQLQDSQHEEIYISDYDGIPFGTRLLFNEFCHLEDLNLLAKQLVTANPADLEKVGAWIQANDTPESLVGLMNLIEQADDIPFYSWGYDGAYDKDEFGNMIYAMILIMADHLLTALWSIVSNQSRKPSAVALVKVPRVTGYDSVDAIRITEIGPVRKAIV